MAYFEKKSRIHVVQLCVTWPYLSTEIHLLPLPYLFKLKLSLFWSKSPGQCFSEVHSLLQLIEILQRLTHYLILKLVCVRRMFWLTAVMHCDMFVFFPWRLSLNWAIQRVRQQQSYTVAPWSLMRDMLPSLRRRNFTATSGWSLIQITTPSCSGGLLWLERQGDWGSVVRMFVSLLLTRPTSTVSWRELFCSMVRSCFFLREKLSLLSFSLRR